MKRRGFIAVLLIGVGTGVWWAWRNRKVRERVQNLAKEVVRRSHTVRELVRKVFKPQVRPGNSWSRQVLLTPA